MLEKEEEDADDEDAWALFLSCEFEFIFTSFLLRPAKLSVVLDEDVEFPLERRVEVEVVEKLGVAFDFIFDFGLVYKGNATDMPPSSSTGVLSRLKDVGCPLEY